MFKTGFVALALCWSTGFAIAQQALSDLLKREMSVSDESLAQCQMLNGKSIEDWRCTQWKRQLAEAYSNQAKAARHAAEAQAANERFELERAAQNAARESEREALDKRRAVEYELRQAEIARLQMQRDEAEKADKAEIQAQGKRDAALRAKCGDDYKAPRVGMQIARAKQCVTAMRMTGQINRADGIVTTYEGGNSFFHVMEGRIVAWGRF